MIRRAFFNAKVKAGWPVKWGGKWDLAFPGKRLVSVGVRSLQDMSYKDWVDFARKHESVDSENK